MRRWFPFLGHVLAFNSTTISTRTALDLRLPGPIPGLWRSADRGGALRHGGFASPPKPVELLQCSQGDRSPCSSRSVSQTDRRWDGFRSECLRMK
ncbi:hypothetical protein B0T26DRAFT_734335 [Lasiosphaeria miniovina]|uniref:Uncharacterized protein n=1 Tax=Lasiosphaeria miniovina TaxID=1954250 RepID=A0AA40DHM9_9PEZI|nr:uncharacterized protein B0T26DRAFT_734335 [Lasiosphaeria miniovina]KAK0701706.1 hypothetical protein B0T26DRAFT_734335 [Lasiosphaeria miniovina]